MQTRNYLNALNWENIKVSLICIMCFTYPQCLIIMGEKGDKEGKRKRGGLFFVSTYVGMRGQLQVSSSIASISSCILLQDHNELGAQLLSQSS